MSTYPPKVHNTAWQHHRQLVPMCICEKSHKQHTPPQRTEMTSPSYSRWWNSHSRATAENLPPQPALVRKVRSCSLDRCQAHPDRLSERLWRTTFEIRFTFAKFVEWKWQHQLNLFWESPASFFSGGPKYPRERANSNFFCAHVFFSQTPPPPDPGSRRLFTCHVDDVEVFVRLDWKFLQCTRLSTCPVSGWFLPSFLVHASKSTIIMTIMYSWWKSPWPLWILDCNDVSNWYPLKPKEISLLGWRLQ